MPSEEFVVACAVLGIQMNATAAEVKAAYRARAALLHPDVHQHSGGERSSAATAAMQQLNDAYRLVIASVQEDKRQGSRPPGADLLLRCARCRQTFGALQSDLEANCPSCGQRLRISRRSNAARTDETERAGEREVVYSSGTWVVGRRALLELALVARGIPHNWERGDLVVDSTFDREVDACVASLDSLDGVPASTQDRGNEVCYSIRNWSRERLSVVQQGLKHLDCEFYVEGDELVVDKSSERLADVVVDLLVFE